MKHSHKHLGQNLTDAEAAEYTEVYQRGSDLLERHINLQDQEPVPSEEREAELQEGIRLLQRAVAILPTSWPAHWLIGKGHQALGDHQRAYEAFRQAASITQQNADVLRELCLACLDLGKHAEAVAAARLALQIDRSDPGLQANLALALLLDGDINEALDQAEQAAARSPEDEINRNLLFIIQEVKEGRRRQPTSLAELET